MTKYSERCAFISFFSLTKKENNKTKNTIKNLKKITLSDGKKLEGEHYLPLKSSSRSFRDKSSKILVIQIVICKKRKLFKSC